MELVVREGFLEEESFRYGKLWAEKGRGRWAKQCLAGEESCTAVRI